MRAFELGIARARRRQDYVLSSDETLFMDVQQAINLALYARLRREGIALAAPHALEVRESTPAILPKSA